MISVMPISISGSDNMKPTIRMLDNGTFTFLGEIDEAESVTINKKWRGVGKVEFTISRFARDVNKLFVGSYIYLPAEPDMMFRITFRVTDKGDKDLVNITAMSVENIMGQRLLIPPRDVDGKWTTANYTKVGVAETVMKDMILYNLSNGENRGFSLLDIAPDQGRGEEYTIDSRFTNMGEEIENFSLATSLGWTIRPKLREKRLEFEILEGAKRDVILSVDNGCLLNLELTESIANYENFAWIGGQGEGVDRVILTTENTNGWDYDISDIDKFEVFVDGKDVPVEIEPEDDDDPDSKPTPRPEEDIEADLISRGQQELLESPFIMSIEAELNQYGHRRYGEHYTLGDTVTIEDTELNVTMQTQLIEVDKIFEDGDVIIKATFGNTVPTFISRIKRTLNRNGVSNKF